MKKGKDEKLGIILVVIIALYLGLYWTFSSIIGFGIGALDIVITLINGMAAEESFIYSAALVIGTIVSIVLAWKLSIFITTKSYNVYTKDLPKINKVITIFIIIIIFVSFIGSILLFKLMDFGVSSFRESEYSAVDEITQDGKIDFNSYEGQHFILFNMYDYFDYGIDLTEYEGQIIDATVLKEQLDEAEIMLIQNLEEQRTSNIFTQFIVAVANVCMIAFVISEVRKKAMDKSEIEMVDSDV